MAQPAAAAMLTAQQTFERLHTIMQQYPIPGIVSSLLQYANIQLRTNAHSLPMGWQQLHKRYAKELLGLKFEIDAWLMILRFTLADGATTSRYFDLVAGNVVKMGHAVNKAAGLMDRVGNAKRQEGEEHQQHQHQQRGHISGDDDGAGGSPSVVEPQQEQAQEQSAEEEE